MTRCRFLYLLLIFNFALFAERTSERFPSKPDNYVTDKAGVLSATDINALNTKLKIFEDSTSIQIFVYIASSLNGENIEQLSQDVFHEWHIGQKAKNNGVLIAIFKDDHKFRIQTGYGLEGQLPDLLTKRIQDEHMRPRFKEGNYYQGISDGIDQLIYYTKHTFVPDSSDLKRASKKRFSFSPRLLALIPFYLFNLVAFILAFYHLLGRRGKRYTKKNRRKMALWFLLLFPIPFVGAIVTFIIGFKKDLLPPPGNSGYNGTTYSSGSSGYSSSSYSSSSSSSDFGGGGGRDSGGGGSSSDW